MNDTETIKITPPPAVASHCCADPIGTVLKHKNWTGLTLKELVEAGRVIPSDTKTIWDFVKAALGEPKDMEEYKAFKVIQSDVQGAFGLI